MAKKSACGGSYPLSGNLLNLHLHLKKKLILVIHFRELWKQWGLQS